MDVKVGYGLSGAFPAWKDSGDGSTVLLTFLEHIGVLADPTTAGLGETAGSEL